MSKSFFFTAFLLCAGIGGAFAQTDPKDQYPVSTYSKSTTAERQATPIQPLREADVVYNKQVVRMIDVREKKNLPLNWPKRPLNKLIGQLVTETNPYGGYSTSGSGGSGAYAMSEGGFGRIQAYKNDSFTTTYTAEEAARVGGQEITYDIQYSETEPWLTKDTTVFEMLDYSTINKYMVLEEWIFDKQTGTYGPRIIGIAPVYKPSVNGITTAFEMPMYWLKWSEARQVLAQYEVFNPMNDGQHLSFADFFDMRLFSSYIIKENNAFDYAIRDFPEYRDSPMEALYESERIREELITKGDDWWEY